MSYDNVNIMCVYVDGKMDIIMHATTNTNYQHAILRFFLYFKFCPVYIFVVIT